MSDGTMDGNKVAMEEFARLQAQHRTAQLARLRERLRTVTKEWEAKAAVYDAEADAPKKNDDDRRTALAKLIAATALRDCARDVRRALDEKEG